LAETFSNEPNVVVAKVDAEADNSKATAKEYGVSSYPTIKFFAKGSTTAVDYEGGRREENFVSYLNENAGTHRVAGGGLDDLAGTIEAIDDIVTKYIGGTHTLTDAAAAAKKAAESLKEQAQYKYAEYYIRVFDKLAKSDGYAAKEFARLDGIIKRGGLAPTKLDELSSKVNILRKFVNKVTGEKDEL